MAERGITGEVAEEICEKLAAFANFGFPESHSVSFAYLVYASSWFKLHYPAAFCAALLQRPADGLLLAAVAGRRRPPPRGARCAPPTSTPRLATPPSSPRLDAGPRHGVRQTAAGGTGCGAGPATWGWGGPAVRLGIVLGARDRRRPGPARSPPAGPTPVPRTWPAGCGLDRARLEALATAGAFGCFGDCRPAGRALWAAGAAAQVAARPAARDRRRGSRRPACRAWSDREEAVADLWATGVAPDGHPTRFVRDRPRPRGRGARGRSWRTHRRRRAGCWSAGWSPTASARPPRRASPS